MTEPNRLPSTGHGHVYPRPDGVKARCGGPAFCQECARDAAEKNRELTAMIQGVGKYRRVDNETVLRAIERQRGAISGPLFAALIVIPFACCGLLRGVKEEPHAPSAQPAGIQGQPVTGQDSGPAR